MAPLLDPTWNETNGTLHSMNGDTSSGDDRILPQGDDYSDEEVAIGDDEVDGPPTAKQKTSVRKQQDRDDFRAHIRLNETRLLAERKRKKDPQEREEILSLKELMAQQESTRIISNPRDYQMKLFERAKERNTIAVLDTGSGKTLIAVLLLKHTIDQELEDRAGGLPPRISFFLVDKVALVYQQHAVLKANLDQPTEAFSGQNGTDLWTREAWAQHFKTNQVIVCTAAVLHHCLFHAFITIEQINLLIFDEAHHAKKNHPYAQIIREFYLKTKGVSRKPRIFGMTASPVDGETGSDDVKARAKELEVLLTSTIATSSDPTLFQGKTVKTATEILRFNRGGTRPMRSAFQQELFTRYASFDPLKKLFPLADDYRLYLGTWCSDRYWSFACSDAQAKKREAKQDRQLNKRGQINEKADEQIARLGEAHEHVQNHELEAPVLEAPFLSNRVCALVSKLQAHFERPSDHKCLVFVERRATAKLLHDVVQHFGGPNLRSGVMTGTSAANLDSVSYSHKEQAVTMMKFRKGELNCLFATSVAEEGIDVPECNVVIRFDPCKTMIQYIQSRGRARRQNSKFILLQEAGNDEEVYKLKEIMAAEDALRKFCQSLPADRLIDAEDHEISSLAHAKTFGRVYEHPTTKAKLTYDFALIVLQNFVSRLPHEDDEDISIHYAMHSRQGKFICEVILPPSSPIKSALGLLSPRKLVARQSAAFDACIMLVKGHYLDENFLPTYAKQLPTLRNARLAIKNNKQDSYAMQSKPCLWSEGRGHLPGTYYMTIISLDAPWDRAVRALALITRMRLPQLPSFPIYRLDGVEVNVVCCSVGQQLSLATSEISQLMQFNLAIYYDLFHKIFEDVPEKMSHWLAPVRLDVSNPTAVEHLDWKLLHEMASTKPYHWTREMGPDHLIGKFLIDPFHGGTRLRISRLAPEFAPTDPVPPGVKKRAKTKNIIEYSSNAYKTLHEAIVWDKQQPVYEADTTMHRLNVLATPSLQEQAASTQCFVIPQPFLVSLLPADVINMGYLFPAIIHRMESYLIALDFCFAVGVSVSPALALESLTKDSDNTDEAQAEQVNFQRGMGNNYERLEFIGDCFLKLATTIAVFVKFDTHDEYFMHCDRMTMLTNTNLCVNAKERELYRFVRGKAFSRRTWYPHGIKLLEGKGAKTQEQEAPESQPLGDKTIADICEALIGACFVMYYKDGCGSTTQLDQSVKAVTSLVNHNTHVFDGWSEYYEAYAKVLPKYQTGPANAAQLDLAIRVQEEHRYVFTHPRLLRCAFTHPSIPKGQEGVPSYQRLEFLGDALLDMTAVNHLAQRHKEKDPGWLTEHKMAMVSNKFLGALCVRLGFHRHLRHYHASLEAQIRHYVEEIEDAERTHQGERDYWMQVKEAPKCLPDIVESYVGAVFVDSGFDFREVQRFFDEHIKWYFEDMAIYDTFASNHPLTRVFHVLSEELGCRSVRLMAEEAPAEDGMNSVVIAAMKVHNHYLPEGQSSGSKYAKIKAANNALKILDGLAPYEFRKRYGCNCTKAAGDLGPIGDPALVMEDLGTAI